MLPDTPAVIRSGQVRQEGVAGAGDGRMAAPVRVGRSNRHATTEP